MAFLGASHAIERVYCNFTYVMKRCSACLGDNKTKCDTAYASGALMLVILVFWALYLIRRCRKPGFLRYWNTHARTHTPHAMLG